MLPMPVYTRALLVGVLLLVMGGCAEKRRVQPVAIDGILDLSDWDFEKDGGVELEGQWRFVWEEFVQPIPSEDFRAIHTGTIVVPSIWLDTPHPTKDNELLPGQGYGTYLLEIRLPEKEQPLELALAMVDSLSAAHWWVRDKNSNAELGQAKQGVPGKTLSETIADIRKSAVYLKDINESNITVSIHVSNFVHARGGLWKAPVLDTRDGILKTEKFELILNSTIFGICLIIALYHFVLFVQRREDRASLFFGGLCFFVSVRGCLTSYLPQELGLEADYTVLLSLEYMSLPFCVMAVGLFVQVMVPDRNFSRFVGICCVSFGAILVMVVTFAPVLVFTGSLPLIKLHLALGSAVVVLHTCRHAMLGNRLAGWMSLAFLIGFAGTLNDILYSSGFTTTLYVAPYTFIVLILMQSGILSGKSANAFKRAQHLGENLQKEVESQTHDLQLKTQESIQATRDAIIAKEESDSLRTAAETAQRDAEHLRAEAELQAHALQEIDQQKTAFFQNMSHELRTPLTLILGPLESASKRIPGDSDIHTANRNALRLLRLVNQLLDFQKLEAGKKKLDLQSVNLTEFVETCGEYFCATCQERGIHFSVSQNGNPIDSTTDRLVVIGEIDALEKIVFNYLSNALKYTPKAGKIELGVNVDDEHIRIFVKDTGPGIAAEDRSKLFQVFSQVENSTTRAYEGTGLGLALVKSLAEEMKGEVGLESAVGKGSTFWAEFPKPTESIRPSIVLLVDDDQVLLDTMAIRMALKYGENQVLRATSAEEARRVLETHMVYCVVSDARMPDEDGAELLAFVRTAYPEVGRILLTGQADNELLQRAINDADVHKVMYKPCKTEEIMEGVDAFLPESARCAQEEKTGFQPKNWLLASGQAKTGEEDTGVFKALDSALESTGDLILVVDDLPDMRNLIHRQLQDRGYRVMTAPNGAHALEATREHRPSLVVTDWMMPEMSGPQLIQAIRSESDIASTPVVLLTAKSDEESKLMGTELGADAFLGKPFNDKELASVIRNLLALKKREKEVEALNREISENVLSRYLPPALVEDILKGQFEFAVEPKEKLVTVLFSDLCGFTKLGETLSAQAYADQLNEYLSLMNDIIFANSGTIDKFMGDAIMVLFGAPKEMSAYDQSHHAIGCARAMQEGLDNLNREWGERGLPKLAARIGIHQGRAVVGNFGSAKRSDYTCIGSTVNLASRIEGVCEVGRVFVSCAIGEQIPNEVSEVGSFQLRGVDGDQTLYRLTP